MAAERNLGRHLYVGTNKIGQVGYVGIGTEDRPWQKHSPEADAVLRDGEVLTTTIPFSTPTDAAMAESLVIRALVLAQQGGLNLTNIAKRNSSAHIAPAMKYRKGTVKYSALRSAVIVKVKPGQAGERVGISEASSDADLALRCCRWWGFGAAVGRSDPIKYLVAVTASVKPPRIIGVWRTRPVADWWFEDQEAYDSDPKSVRSTGEAWNDSLVPSRLDRERHCGWVAVVATPDPEVRGWRGKVFDSEGYQMQQVGFSQDIRNRW